MKYVCIFLIEQYKKYISPLKAPCCRFTPSCSQYAIEAFSRWGFLIGFYLSLFRVARCNPFCRGGADPVPERRNKKDTR